MCWLPIRRMLFYCCISDKKQFPASVNHFSFSATASCSSLNLVMIVRMHSLMHNPLSSICSDHQYYHSANIPTKYWQCFVHLFFYYPFMNTIFRFFFSFLSPMSCTCTSTSIISYWITIVASLMEHYQIFLHCVRSSVHSFSWSWICYLYPTKDCFLHQSSD